MRGCYVQSCSFWFWWNKLWKWSFALFHGKFLPVGTKMSPETAGLKCGWQQWFSKGHKNLRHSSLHVSHSKVTGNVQSRVIWRALPVGCSPEFVIEWSDIKVRTKPVIAERCGTSCRLCFSTFTHPEVLMAIIDACSLISACVDASDVLCGYFGIHRPSQAIKSWPRRITRIDSFN